MMDDTYTRESPWKRGLWMLILAVFFGVAEFVLFVCTVAQFGWMLFAHDRNENIARFGEDLARWMAATARFQTGASDDKPFPWAAWR